MVDMVSVGQYYKHTGNANKERQTTMTTIQKTALELMAEKNLGALIVSGYGWVWPHHIRESVAVAKAVVSQLSK